MIPAEAVEAAAKAAYESTMEDGDTPWEHFGGSSYLDYYRDHARAALAAAAPYAATGQRVTTEEELNALPIGTVVLSEDVTHHEGGWALSYQRWQDGDWHRGARAGSAHPDNFLPVTILHVPQ